MAAGTRASARLRKKPRISYFEREEECFLTQQEEDHVLSHTKKNKSGGQQDTEKRDIFNWAELPGELKNRVYDYALTTPEEIRIRRSESSLRMPTIHRHIHARDEKSLSLTSNLLLVNKKTYNEGAPLLYQNHLSFKDSFTLYLFLHRLNSKQKQWIQHITIELMTGKGFIQPAFDLLIGTSNIKTVTIGDFADRNRQLNIVTRLYYTTYNWLEAVGKEKGDRYAALALINISDSAIFATHPMAYSHFRICNARREIHKLLKEKISAKK